MNKQWKQWRLGTTNGGATLTFTSVPLLCRFVALLLWPCEHGYVCEEGFPIVISDPQCMICEEKKYAVALFWTLPSPGKH